MYIHIYIYINVYSESNRLIWWLASPKYCQTGVGGWVSSQDWLCLWPISGNLCQVTGSSNTSLSIVWWFIGIHYELNIATRWTSAALHRYMRKVTTTNDSNIGLKPRYLTGSMIDILNRWWGVANQNTENKRGHQFNSIWRVSKKHVTSIGVSWNITANDWTQLNLNGYAIDIQEH